ncbi:hypothetical protein BC833DRAFT_526913 [Globomyces pollinis-pini]|nr:hypothetical protein BC833DRAFT_526913 [Globomyces pollinis-pini]
MADTEDQEKRLDAAVTSDQKKKGAKPQAAAGKKANLGKGKGKNKGDKKSNKNAATFGTTPDPNASLLAADTVTEDEENALKKDKLDKSKNEPVYLFEEEEDEGWLSDLDVTVILNRKNEQDLYLKSCKALGLVPVSYISKRLDQPELSMPYHGLGPLGAQALSKVLEVNTFINHLDLSYNCIEDGGQFLGLGLCINTTITYLNLGYNNLKSAGAQLSTMIADNSTIKTLILCGNRFGDAEASQLAEGIRQNQFLQTLDLSHNEIGDLGGIALGVGISQNEGLRELNIGWNEMRNRGITGFLNGCKDNPTLTNLNIEHNGIGSNSACLQSFLAKSSSIQKFNVA